MSHDEPSWTLEDFAQKKISLRPGTVDDMHRDHSGKICLFGVLLCRRRLQVRLQVLRLAVSLEFSQHSAARSRVRSFHNCGVFPGSVAKAAEVPKHNGPQNQDMLLPRSRRSKT